MSCGGGGRAQRWATDVANIWRIGNDHLDCWTDGPCPRAVGYKSNGHGTVQAISYFKGISHFAGPGGWNTGDFLKTGGESCDVNATPGVLCPKQTLEEYRTEFTMWSMASAPLLVSTDVRKLTAIQREVLLNREVIAIDQQPVAGDELETLLERRRQQGQQTRLAPADLDPAWFMAPDAQACLYPRCCATPTGKCQHSEYPLIALGSGLTTAAACQQLCEAHAGCDVWQLGSAARGGHCVSVQNMSTWAPQSTTGGRAAGCKRSAVRGCGSTPPSPSPSPTPHPHRGGGTEVWAKPLAETAYAGTKGWSELADHHAVALLNLGEAAENISAHLPTVLSLWRTGEPTAGATASMVVRDVWNDRSLGGVGVDGLVTAEVGPHEVRLLRVWRSKP